MIKFIKNNLVSVFVIVLLLFSFSAKNSFATNCHNYGGATTYCDDGTSYSNYGGSTTYGSDGTSYSNYGGATTYGSDGSTQSNYGGATTYSNDGTSYSNYGGSTTYGSDGSTYNNYGGSTTYGSGSGKMIEIGGHDDSNQNENHDSTIYSNDYKNTSDKYSCPLNSSYDSLSFSCKCNDGYVASGSSCIYQGSDNSMDSSSFYLPIQQNSTPETDKTSPAVNDEDTVYEVNGIEYSEQDLERIRNKREMRNKEMCGPNAIYIALDQKCVCEVGYKKSGSVCINESSVDEPSNEKDSAFVWWNPLTWRDHFFNKPK